MIRIHRGNTGRAGQRKAERFGDRGHGARGAHGVAGAGGTRHLGFKPNPFRLRDIAGDIFIPEFFRVRARADGLAAVAIVQHRSCRTIDRRNVHADRAHQQARRGLVAAAQQHRPIDRMRA